MLFPFAIQSFKSTMLYRVLKNYFFLMLTSVINLSSQLALTMLIARSLGKNGFGKISFILSFTTLFTFMTNLGTNLLIIRSVARDRTAIAKHINNSLVLTGIFSGFTFCLIVILILLIGQPADIIKGVYIGGLYIIIGGFASLFRGAFHAYELMEYETYVLLLEKIFNLLICFIVLKLGGGIVQIMGSFLMARIINLLVSAGIYLTKINRTISIKANLSFLFFLFKSAFPFGLNILLTTTYIQADVVMLSLMKGDSATGLYRAATALIIPLTFLATSLNSSLYPRMSYLFQSSQEQLKVEFSKSFKYLTQLSLIIMTCIILAADKLIFTIYTGEYALSILPLKILAFVIPVRFLNNSLAVALTSTDKQGLRTFCVAFGAIFNILLNLALIPLISYIGASISSVLTDLTIFAWLYFFIAKHLYKVPLLRVIFKPIISCLLVSLLFFFLRNINLVILIFLSISLYVLFRYLLRDFPKSDLVKVRSLFRKNML